MRREARVFHALLSVVGTLIGTGVALFPRVFRALQGPISAHNNIFQIVILNFWLTCFCVLLQAWDRKDENKVIKI